MPALRKADVFESDIKFLNQVLGTDELNAYLHKYQLELDPQLEALVGRFASCNKF